MRVISIDITSPEAEEVVKRYELVVDHIRDLQPVWGQIMRYLEKLHVRHFQRVAGKRGYERYVKTGRLRESLTQPAGPNAIRIMRPDWAAFGTDLPHGLYLTKAPLDPKNAQLPKPNRPDLRSAVLVLGPTAQRRVARTLLDYIVEPFE